MLGKKGNRMPVQNEKTTTKAEHSSDSREKETASLPASADSPLGKLAEQLKENLQMRDVFKKMMQK